VRPFATLKLGLASVEGPLHVENQAEPSSASHFLHAGQVFVSAEGKSIVMILGSCVGICIWDPAKGVGGATHFLLPSWDGKGVKSARYGDVAVSVLLQKLLEAGAERGQGLRRGVFVRFLARDRRKSRAALGKQER
jgi:hypothetical protein